MKIAMVDLHIMFGGLISPEALIDITEAIIEDGCNKKAMEQYFELARKHRESVRMFLWNKPQNTTSNLVEALERHGIHYRITILPKANVGSKIRAWTPSRKAECQGTDCVEAVIRICELRNSLAPATRISKKAADERINDIAWIDRGPPAFQTIWSARETIAYEEQIRRMNSEKRKKARKVS